jgi:metallophosphoesterase (TIGR00282 family)
MKILFLGDIVGPSGCDVVKKFLPGLIKQKKLDFVIANGENAADNGLGITEKISNELFHCGINVLTTGNHVWDQKETVEHIEREKRLLRPYNLITPAPGKGLEIFLSKNNFKIGVLNLMGNVFMKKCDDVFIKTEKFLEKYKLKKDYDFLVVDFHGEITSEKMAIGHLFDGKATLITGTHTHVPTNDARILKQGSAYITDSGMCGDYDSVIGMNKKNSINKFFKKKTEKNFPSLGEGTLSGVIVDCCIDTGLAKNINSFVKGGVLQNTN